MHTHLHRLKTKLKKIPGLAATYHAAKVPLRKLKRERDLGVRRYCRLLPELVAEPVFVKIGANDGITGDPISDILIAEEKWKGLLIEPAPPCFQRLTENFRDSRRFVLEQVAIGQTNGYSTFYFVDPIAAEKIPGLPDWFDQLGSFDRNHIVKHLDGKLEPFIIEQRVSVRPLIEVLRKNGLQEVHLLHVDTEGYDFEVLRTLDLATDGPAAILIEHKHLAGEDRVAMLKMLRHARYRVDDYGGDYFAVRRDSPLRRLARDRAFAD